jgi:hypothetical protein
VKVHESGERKTEHGTADSGGGILVIIWFACEVLVLPKYEP